MKKKLFQVVGLVMVMVLCSMLFCNYAFATDLVGSQISTNSTSQQANNTSNTSSTSNLSSSNKSSNKTTYNNSSSKSNNSLDNSTSKDSSLPKTGESSVAIIALLLVLGIAVKLGIDLKKYDYIK